MKPAAAFLGLRVRVLLDEHVVVRGKFIAVGDFGSFVIQDDEGEVWHCWPMLEVEKAE